GVGQFFAVPAQFDLRLDRELAVRSWLHLNCTQSRTQTVALLRLWERQGSGGTGFDAARVWQQQRAAGLVLRWPEIRIPSHVVLSPVSGAGCTLLELFDEPNLQSAARRRQRVRTIREDKLGRPCLINSNQAPRICGAVRLDHLHIEVGRY